MADKKEQFTKSEWLLREDGRSIESHIDGGRVLIATAECLPCIGGHDDLAAERAFDMERANAHLIAAAPQLYEALKHCLNHLEQIAARDYPNTTPEMRRFTSAYNARAALSAALGGK